MLAAGMVLAGCSDDLDENGGGGNNVLDGETSFVKVALNLPSTSGSSFRASNSANDQFNDGVAGEYAVNDVILALFYGTSETVATLGYATEITNPSWTDDVDNDNVTRYTSAVTEIPKPADNANVYALAIVNGKKSGHFSVSNGTLTFNRKSNTPATVTTLASFYAAADTMVVDTSKIAHAGSDPNFLMLNAPVSNMPGTTASMSNDQKVTTLVQLPIFDTEEEATAGGATDIYVERAVAKVTVLLSGDGASTGNMYINAPETSYHQLSVHFDGWVLQRTNKKMFAVRNVYSTTSNEYAIPTSNPAWEGWKSLYADSEVNRFFGELSGPYRVYWGIDPNYFSKATADGSPKLAEEFNIWVEGTNEPTDDDGWAKFSSTSETYPLYCAENTSTSANMLRNQMTSVLLKTKIGTEGDLLYVGNTKNPEKYSKTQFIEEATQALNDAGLGLQGDSVLVFKELDAGITIPGEGTDKKSVKDLIGKIKPAEEGTTSTSGLRADTGIDEISDERAAAILSALAGSSGSIQYFKDGVAYYQTTFIKHFGDDPTKFENASDSGDEDSEVDGGTYNDADHLGRYGVLRNNWYELTITGVTGPGSPTIPKDPEEPVDATHSYINAQINILSWAKRQQDVEL